MGMLRLCVLVLATVITISLAPETAEAQYSVPSQVSDEATTDSARIGSARTTGELIK